MGYAGGTTSHPTYRNMGDHSEVVEVEYDPEQITYTDLLAVFREGHNPLRVKRTQYRSAVLFQTDEEQRLARAALEHWSEGVPGGLATSLEPLGTFWPAEDYHQKYRLKRDSPTVKALEKSFGGDWSHTLAATKLNAHAGGYPVDLTGLGTALTTST